MALFKAKKKGDLLAERILIIHNPTAGGLVGPFALTERRLRKLGCHVTLLHTSARGDAERMAREAATRDYDRIVAAGGDGTINEVINGLAGTEMPLALLPLGTANVLAREIGLKVRPGKLAETIVRGKPQPICLGRVRGEDGAERLFVMMAGIGADAHAVAGVNLDFKRIAGKGAYFAEALRQFLVFPFPQYRLNIDGVSHEAASVVIANGRYYAGDYVLAPDARLTDASLHVCIFESAGRKEALRYALAIEQGGLVDLPDYRVPPGKKILVEGPKDDPVQADGDIVAHLPVEIEALPESLNLVMPVAG
ncbi:MAG: diacylglycerol kinase family protein [Kiloniellales bacterium]